MANTQAVSVGLDGADPGNVARAGAEHQGGVAAVVVAAGSGSRLGADVPKALVRVAGLPLVVHAVRGLAESGVDAVVVVAPATHLDEVRALLTEAVPDDGSRGGSPSGRDRAPGGSSGPRASGAAPGSSVRAAVRVEVVAGGASRQASVAAGLAACPAADVVLVHDAARCFAPPAMIRRVIDAVRAGQRAVVPVLPVVDSLVTPAGDAVGEYVDRSRLRAVQTPQGFARETIERAHALAAPADESSAATDDASLAAAVGVTVGTVPGDDAAMKITTPRDVVVAEALFGAP